MSAMSPRQDQGQHTKGRRSCNIEARGRLVRLLGGSMTVAVGVVLLIGLITGLMSGYFWWILTVLALAAGGFQIYEGWAGWCVLRAAGIRTPI